MQKRVGKTSQPSHFLISRLSPLLRGISAASPRGQAKKEAEVVPAARVWDAVDADRVREKRYDEGKRRNCAVDKAPKEASGALKLAVL